MVGRLLLGKALLKRGTVPGRQAVRTNQSHALLTHTPKILGTLPGPHKYHPIAVLTGEGIALRPYRTAILIGCNRVPVRIKKLAIPLRVPHTALLREFAPSGGNRCSATHGCCAHTNPRQVCRRPNKLTTRRRHPAIGFALVHAEREKANTCRWFSGHVYR